MKTNQIAHLGIAVRNIEEALVFYRDTLGLTHTETVVMEDRGLRIAFLQAGEVLIELLEPLHEQSQISRFLDKRGPGIHHICFEVDDIRGGMQKLNAAGFPTLGDTPEIGAEGCPVAFIHPKSTFGVLTEILQKDSE